MKTVTGQNLLDNSIDKDSFDGERNHDVCGLV